MTAQNPNSSAFGSWQCIASTCRIYANRFGFNPKTTDPYEQLTMYKAYVKDRYGSSQNALSFWDANGHY